MVTKRWEHYLLRSGNKFVLFWQELLLEKERNLLFVLGLGFDPRMCAGLKSILDVGGSGQRHCLLIEYDEGAGSPSNVYINLVNRNRQELDQLLGSRGSIRSHNLSMWSKDGQRRTSSRRANDMFTDLTNIVGFQEITDIVVDVSSLPRSIYLSIVAKLLYLIDRAYETKSNTNCLPPNLHVIVAEDSSLDKQIQQQGIDEKATYLHGFSGELDLEATAGFPKIWFPILGEARETELRRIHDYLARPTEICPVIPSPSLNPRRGDGLMLLEYRDLLFDEFRVDPRDIIYASEQNPFEAYRQIYQAIVQYNQALEILGGCKAFISPVSSKLLSLGSLLAAYEIRHSPELKQSGCRVGIIHVESHGYHFIGIPEEHTQPELYELWLAGECYEY